MGIKGSKTEKNLYRTFAGESRARNMYSFFAEQARIEGYMWIAQVFDDIADNEKAHARIAFKKYLREVDCTIDNLLVASKGELQETSETYKKFEEVARDEGFEEIADFYKELGEVEESHYKRFMKIHKELEDSKLLKSSREKKWQCMNCGYIYIGTEVPSRCPLCGYPRGYFMPYDELKCEGE